MQDNFTSGEESAIRAALRRGERPLCPRCGGILDETPIPPARKVAYVRDRILLQCRTCRLKGIVDRR